MYNLPNILTISRIVVIPVIFLSIYINWTSWSILAAVLYAVAAITDYFDGYLARSRNQVSIFGRLLDPIADKLLVVAALLIIVAKGMIHPISYIPVMIILCREVLVSGLREFLAQMNVDMPVTKLAKWKTAFQMVSIGCILFSAIPCFAWVNGIGELLIWVAGALTFITGYAYFQKSLNYVKAVHNKKEPTKKVVVAKETAVETKKTVLKKTETKPAAKKVTKKKPTKKTVTKKELEKKAAPKPAVKKVAAKTVVSKKTTKK